MGRAGFRERFVRRRAGVAAAAILAVLYASALAAPFIAPNDPQRDAVEYRYAPPQWIHVHDTDGWHRPFVFALASTRDPSTNELTWTPDRTHRLPVRFFVEGDAYSLLGIGSSRLHLLGAEGPMHLLGTDRRGRDLFSRMLVGARISLTIGLAGVALSMLLGSILGTVSGWYGGTVDLAMQRAIELLSSFPSIPLWLALAAALPSRWSPLAVYFAITVILSLLGWGGIARQVRGKILATREAEYVLAAQAAGAGSWYLIRRHLLPAARSHLIVTAALSIPGMILGETALSFLGLGIRSPLVSWGVLLSEAERVSVLLQYPWLLFPAVPIVLTVASWNVFGDAMRDAIDPWL